jgi:hypothetical protein
MCNSVVILTQEAPMLKWFEFPFYLLSLVEYDGCFLGASYYILAAAEGSTQEAPIITY